MKAYRKAYTVFAAAMTAVILSMTAYASYIDVSATTYIIQIVAGVTVAAGAVIGVVISRIKKKAKEKFNIDLEKKETEEDVVIYDDSDSDASDKQ